MAKYLKDILKQAHDTIKGVRSSTTDPLSIGKDPGVDYKPKAGDEADFVAKHSVQKWDEPHGNPNYANKVGYVLKSPEEKRHGNTESKAKATNEEVQIDEISTNLAKRYIKKASAQLDDADEYDEKQSKKMDRREAGIRTATMKTYGSKHINVPTKEETQTKKAEDVKCNRTPGQTWCPIHEMVDCSSSRTIKEKDVSEAWTVTHADGKVTTHANSGEAMRASRKSPGSKVGATHGAMGQRAHDVLSPHQTSNYGTFSASGYTPPAKKVKEEVEQIDEISAKTVGSYIDKAHKSPVSQDPMKNINRGKSLSLAGAKLNPQRGALHGHKIKVPATEEVEHIEELSTDLLHRAAKKAANKAMWDAEGTTGKKYKKYAAMANKFRKKGMEQEKKERSMKEEVEIDEVSSGLAHRAAIKAWNKSDKMRDDAKNEPDIHSHAQAMQKASKKNQQGNKFIRYAQGMKEDTIDEKHLTPAEMKKREEIARAIHRKTPSMPMSKKMAIATATAKKVAEEVLDEKLTDDAKKNIRTALGPKVKGNPLRDTSKPAKAMIGVAKMNPKNVKEDLAQPLLQDNPPRGYSDEAAEMVKTELKALANKAMHLVMQMPDSMHVEPWCQAKLAQAKSMVSDVHDYMIYGDHDKPEEEGTMDTPMTFPNMSVDVNTGQNV